MCFKIKSIWKGFITPQFIYAQLPSMYPVYTMYLKSMAIPTILIEFIILLISCLIVCVL